MSVKEYDLSSDKGPHPSEALRTLAPDSGVSLLPAVLALGAALRSEPTAE